MVNGVVDSYEDWMALAERVKDVFIDEPDEADLIESDIYVGEPLGAIQEGVRSAIHEFPHLVSKLPKEIKMLAEANPYEYWYFDLVRDKLP